jgi:hypothetical protein
MRALHRLIGRPLALVAACLVTASACASSGASSSGRPVTQTMGSADVGRIAITTNSEADVTTLAFDADAVFRVLPSLFDSLGVTVNTLDPARRQIGNNGFKIRQRLGKAILSTLLDCGASQIGPNADGYDVYMSVMTTVTPNGAGSSRLATLVEAQARPVTFNQAYNRCTSKGNLEERLTNLVTRRLTK